MSNQTLLTVPDPIPNMQNALTVISIVVTLILAVFGWVKYTLKNETKEREKLSLRVDRVASVSDKHAEKIDSLVRDQSESGKRQDIHNAKIERELTTLNKTLLDFTSKYGFVLELFTGRVKKTFEDEQ